MSRRPFSRVLLASVLAPVVTLSFGAVVWRLHSQQVRAAGVAAQADALTAARRERPVHAGPSRPGTFGDALQPALPALRVMSKARQALPEAVRAGCDSVHDGEQPWQALPRECAVLLAAHRDDVLRAFAATRAERGGLPEDLRGLRPLDDPEPLGNLLPLMDAARLGGLLVREALTRGDPDAAVGMCLDVLALGRDVAVDGMLVPQMIASSVVGRALRPCAAALDAASRARKEQALSELGRLEQGWPTFEVAMRFEEVWANIQFRCVRLSPEQAARLPPEARRFALSTEAQLESAWPGVTHSSWLDDLLHRPLACHRFTSLYPELVAAGALPRAARDAALEAVAESTRGSTNPLLSGDSNWVRFARRIDERQDVIAALLLLVELELQRTDAAAWPLTLKALDGRATLEAAAPDAASATLLLQLGAEGEPTRLPLTADLPRTR